MNIKETDEPPGGESNYHKLNDISNNHKRKWRDWHERETPLRIEGTPTRGGVRVKITFQDLYRELEIVYPNSIWQKYPQENKVKLVDNITYLFTAHLPFLLKGNIRSEYNTGYPQVFSWANQCFMRFLPAYWYLYRGKRGTKVFPLLKTLLNSRSVFSETKDVPPRFPVSIDEQIIIPFTFGKDSFLTYNVAKEIGLKPTLIYFNEPTEEYARGHKLKLIKDFCKEEKEKVYYLENPLGSLREYGEGWFGWELALTSWALLSLPFAYYKKAGYIVFANETSCNDFFYDKENLKVLPDYEQSGQATEELSLLSQALSEGEVYTTTFLQGLHEITNVAILKQRYSNSLKYLMSCWAETKEAERKRWCATCSKCARIYLYLTANGVDPVKEAGFEDNLLLSSCEKLYNIFGRRAAGTGFDSFGTNRDEQLLAFYLTFLRGNRDPLIVKFSKSNYITEAKNRFNELISKYFQLHEEYITPPQWKKKIDLILERSLKKAREEIRALEYFEERTLLPYKQMADWTCGPAALKITLNYFGIKKGISELIEELKATPEKGTDHKDMIHVAKKYLPKSVAKHKSSIENIKKLLKNHLVIVDYWVPYYQESHYSVVKSISRGNIYLNDSYFGNKHRYKINYFLENWWDPEADRWLLAIKK